MSFKALVDKAKETVGKLVSGDRKVTQTQLGSSGLVPINLDRNYKLQSKNWFRTLPYGFKFHPRNGNLPITFFLPIAPSNIQVNTPFATNVISTMYGTVEEHSEIRYHDIVISGTTGMAPKYTNIFTELDQIKSHKRSSYDTKLADSISNAAGGFFKKTLEQFNTARNAIRSTANVINGDDRVPNAVLLERTGFAAFHNFFRFLLEYKRDAAGVDSREGRTKHPLTFLNYKDGVEYDCAIQNFTLVRSASDPYLYNYTIQMRCYNMRSIGDGGLSQELSTRLDDLGLNGIENSSIFNKASGFASGAKAAVSGIVSSIKGFGG